MAVYFLLKGSDMNSLTVGPPAEGENFFERPDIIEDIWQAIEAGSHILIAAPRRVGKTSIMLKLREEPQDGYGVVYITTESADSEAEFWKKLFNGLIDDDNTRLLNLKSQKLSESLHSFISTIKKVSIAGSGIEFGDGVFDYASAFEKMVSQLELDKKLVIMIDEFPQTIENIKEYEDEKSARSFLKTNRSIRQNPAITDKITFIYTGSIGLESVAEQLGGIKFINDLNSIKVLPLTQVEASGFIELLLETVDLEMSEEVIDYLVETIEWHLPFYFQLIIQGLERSCRRESISEITDTKQIDSAIDEVLQDKIYFENWNSRLKQSFDNALYKYAKAILNYLSEKHTIESSVIADIATKMGINDPKEVIDTLKYDGYINNNDNPKIYRFNSPILRMWWCKNVAN